MVRTKRGRTTVLKDGDFFGEMSLIDGEPRSATVEATTPIRLLVLGQKDFWRVLHSTASLVPKVMHTLCQRLRAAEEAVLEMGATRPRIVRPRQPHGPGFRGYGVSTILPKCSRASKHRWASRTSDSGSTAWITGSRSPLKTIRITVSNSETLPIGAPRICRCRW